MDQANNRHETALFAAVKYRRLWAVNMLLYRNARVDIKNDQGYTPLMYAVEEGQTRIVAALKQSYMGEHLSVLEDVAMPNRRATMDNMRSPHSTIR